MEGGLTFYSCALAASGRHLAPYMTHVLHAKVQLQPLLAYCAVPCVQTCLLSADTMLARRSMPLTWPLDAFVTIKPPSPQRHRTAIVAVRGVCLRSTVGG